MLPQLHRRDRDRAHPEAIMNKSAQPCILIVEDEPALRETLVWSFGREGFRVVSTGEGHEALRLARSERPDLVLLDLMLPDISGKKVCRTLGADPTTQGIPVVMVTARDSETDRILGFELGASDYVVKPFSMRELLLRARAILRRRRADEDGADRTVLRVANVVVDPEAWRVEVDDQQVPLTAQEFSLLEAFLRNRGRVLSRDALLDLCWPKGAAPLDRTVDAMVMRLRQKLGSASHLIETVRGVGYRCR